MRAARQQGSRSRSASNKGSAVSGKLALLSRSPNASCRTRHFRATKLLRLRYLLAIPDVLIVEQIRGRSSPAFPSSAVPAGNSHAVQESFAQRPYVPGAIASALLLGT